MITRMLAPEDERALDEIEQIVRHVDPTLTIDRRQIDIVEATDPPARTYWLDTTRAFELHPQGVVETSVEGGLVYIRSITRAGKVAKMRVEPGPPSTS
jgi:hypothetical protein